MMYWVTGQAVYADNSDPGCSLYPVAGSFSMGWFLSGIAIMGCRPRLLLVVGEVAVKAGMQVAA